MSMHRSLVFLLLTSGCAKSGKVEKADKGLAELYDELDLEWHIHDPSRAVSDGERSLIGVTGKENADGYDCGLEIWSRTDGTDWKPDTCLLRDKPAWVADEAPGNDGAYWAPAMVDANTLYYSVSDFETDSGCIARATRSAGGNWTDHGAPITCSQPEDDDHPDVPNSIDPAWLIDEEGTAFVVYGAESIWSVEVDPETGEPIDGSTQWDAESSAYHHLASLPEVPDENGETWIEAPYIHHDGAHYYLFVNWYSCCRGIHSTYEIRVGRSAAATGPFLDQEGRDLREGGGTLLIDSGGDVLGDPSMIGPGHAAINSVDGGLELSFHYYDANEEGLPWIASVPIHFCDGWPDLSTGR